METRDPREFATGLAARLATRSRHVCMFLGAGTAKACGLPSVDELEDLVLKGLESPQIENGSLGSLRLTGRNLETALSRLRRIAKLISG